MEYIFYIGIIILAIIGISDILCYFAKQCYPTPYKTKIIILPLRGDVDNIEYIINTIITKEFFNCKIKVKIYIINNGIEKETLDIIHILQKKYRNIFISS